MSGCPEQEQQLLSKLVNRWATVQVVVCYDTSYEKILFFFLSFLPWECLVGISKSHPLLHYLTNFVLRILRFYQLVFFYSEACLYLSFPLTFKQTSRLTCIIGLHCLLCSVNRGLVGLSNFSDLKPSLYHDTCHNLSLFLSLSF